MARIRLMRTFGMVRNTYFRGKELIKQDRGTEEKKNDLLEARFWLSPIGLKSKIFFPLGKKFQLKSSWA